MGRRLLELLEGEADGAVELGVAAGGVVLGGDVHLDVGVGAVVFHAQPTSSNQKLYSGWVVTPPSTKRLRGLMPITPPQVRLPISVPSCMSLKQWLKMSPSEPASSSVTATMGPGGE